MSLSEDVFFLLSYSDRGQKATALCPFLGLARRLRSLTKLGGLTLTPDDAGCSLREIVEIIGGGCVIFALFKSIQIKSAMLYNNM